MDSLREYILSVICIVISCGILQSVLKDCSAASLVKFICGMVVSIVVFSPIIREEILHFDIIFDHMNADAAFAVSEGQTAAEELRKQHIKESTEAYILTRASELGASITVVVDLAENYPNVPETVTIRGDVSPYAKQRLIACVTGDLGIAEEKQKWIS